MNEYINLDENNIITVYIALLVKEDTVIKQLSTNIQTKIKETIKNLCFKLQSQGINIIFKEKTYNKFTVIDNRVVWYGGISTLGFTNLEESIMRIEDYRISKELLRDFSNKT